MTIHELKTHLGGFPVFSILDIKKVDPGFNNQRLSEWQTKGYITKVIKGYYIFSDTQKDESFLFHTSNKIYTPSYISLESALSFYNLIPEGVYTVTAVTTLKTEDYETPIGKFTYKSFKENLMFGYYVATGSNGVSFKVAEIEKALLDYLYINPHLDSIEKIEELRLNEEVIQSLFSNNIDKLVSYVRLFDSKVLIKRIEKVISTYLPHDPLLMSKWKEACDA